MAHNLELNDKKKTHSFVAYGEAAWHGLGIIIDHPMTAEEVVKLANMDYNVDTTPIIIRPEGVEQDIIFPQRFATYRTDNNCPLGIVSGDYQVVQNSDAFKFFDPIIDRGEAIYQTAGVLGKGERVFITAKLPEDIVMAGEKVEQYLLITNGHDGLNSVRVGFTPIRVVCNNTLTAALIGLRNSVTIPHINNPAERLRQAHLVMGLSSRYVDGLKSIVDAMAEVKVNDDQLMSYIETLFVNQKYVDQKGKPSTRANNSVKKVFNFTKYHETQQAPATKGTLYGAYNGVSGYFGHVKDFKGPEQRMNSLCFGTAYNRTNQAFALAQSAMDDIAVLDRKLVTV